MNSTVAALAATSETEPCCASIVPSFCTRGATNATEPRGAVRIVPWLTIDPGAPLPRTR